MIQQWESQHFSQLFLSLWITYCPMFHRVVVQTQIKPGTGFWGFELWKEKPVEVFSTALWPNHVIPGRIFTKFGSDHTWDGRRQKCAVLRQWDHPQSLKLYPSQTQALCSRNFGKRKLGNTSSSKGSQCGMGSKMDQNVSQTRDDLIRSAPWVCHSWAKKIAT